MYEIYNMYIICIYIYIYNMYEQDLALNNLEGLICHKKTTNQPNHTN